METCKVIDLRQARATKIPRGLHQAIDSLAEQLQHVADGVSYSEASGVNVDAAVVDELGMLAATVEYHSREAATAAIRAGALTPDEAAALLHRPVEQVGDWMLYPEPEHEPDWYSEPAWLDEPEPGRA